MRKVRDQPRDQQLDNTVFYNHLTVRQRIGAFFGTKKKRLFLILLFVATFNFTGNIASMFMAMIERNFKKNKKEWV